MRYIKQMNGQAILLFDGFCILCSNSIRFIERHQKKNVFRFVPLKSKEALELLEGLEEEGVLPDSIILIQDGRTFTRSSAVLKIALKLRFPWALLSVFFIVPRFVRDPLYDWIARHRERWFGSSTSCYIPGSNF